MLSRGAFIEFLYRMEVPATDARSPQEKLMRIKRSVSIRLAPEDEAAVAVVVERVPLANVHAVVVAAFRAGLPLLVADPVKALELLRAQRVQVRPVVTHG